MGKRAKAKAKLLAETNENKYKTIDFINAERRLRFWLYFPVLLVIIGLEIGLAFIPAIHSKGIYLGLLFTAGCALILLTGYKYFTSFSKSDKFLKNVRVFFRTDNFTFRTDKGDVSMKYSEIESISVRLKSTLGIKYCTLKFKFYNHKPIVFKSEDTMKFAFKESVYYDVLLEFAQRNPNIKITNIKDYGKLEKRGEA